MLQMLVSFSDAWPDLQQRPYMMIDGQYNIYNMDIPQKINPSYFSYIMKFYTCQYLFHERGLKDKWLHCCVICSDYQQINS